MADSAAQVRRVVQILRDDGFKVVEVSGWESRGKGPMTTRGRIEHHTASPYGSSDTASLRVVTFGRADLRNSLCRWYVSRTGVIYLVALHKSWHAGTGIKGSNSTLSGTEAEHSGISRERWSDASLAAQAAISRAESRVFAFGTSRVWDHKEHAPSRKVDRHGIDPDHWRARLDDIPEEDVMTPDQEAKLDRLLDAVDTVPRDVWTFPLPHAANVNKLPAWRWLARLFRNNATDAELVRQIVREEAGAGNPDEVADRVVSRLADQLAE